MTYENLINIRIACIVVCSLLFGISFIIIIFLRKCLQDIDEAKGDYLNDLNDACAFEVQTASIGDGVLPGIIRQIAIE